MSKYKILFQISGSIAAYKSAYLISKLVQNGFEVQTIATQSTLQFIGKATLEGLTSKQVLTDQFQDGEMMNHITLMKWADLIILAPASANTINKMANGLADNLITSLFLAYNFDKPYLIAPAMNTNMFQHPSTQSSIEKLKNWGIKILPTDSGYLACGDYGSGKLLEPDKIYDYIIESLSQQKASSRKSILITAGATREKIDEVRFITNISTGTTASSIADQLISKGNTIIYLHGKDSKIPKANCQLIEFTSFSDLQNKLYNLLRNNHFDFIIHLAAVSDFTVDKIESQGEQINLEDIVKIDSGINSLKIYLKQTEKLVDKIKTISRNKNLRLIAFKFSGADDFDHSINEAEKLFTSADYVVINLIRDRQNNIQKNFLVIDKFKNQHRAVDSKELAEIILQIIEGK
ncbi:Phosphopantothenoylcysteine synthetase/decarboxylase [Ignavibacterium album JCM 16511]|uniref:Coenzyme A biosynthesis bifunctional protein CoaBC n=1 Tax=Ignavibacterium album (strain DSM 19864 / JCM 16511 / NBRC 101810 / Mat9-16) TaxID=945713 RepID=I0AFL8_IGNAJ|nr:bifunctional phosphopantothenoylcysteine decarboxylase/phosphopantothenate--cysteine ligase CoaBC [Ignavibacterium album]AFH47775.1 Phosphopantothenoylcysteine synthetase/decarboxylase [Ignavibacterium album JCM 16511]